MKLSTARCAVKLVGAMTSNTSIPKKKLFDLVESHTDVDEADKQFLNQLIGHYLTNRRRLKLRLTKVGIVGVLSDTLTEEELEEFDIEELAERVAIEVGPFSFNIFMSSSDAQFFRGDLDDKINGFAREDDRYPYSIIIVERESPPTAGERVLSAIFNEKPRGRVEKHENMHHFANLVASHLEKVHGPNPRAAYLRAHTNLFRLERLANLNAPGVILEDNKKIAVRWLSKLPEFAGLSDFAAVTDRALRAFYGKLHGYQLEEVLEQTKDEIVSFLWSRETMNIKQRLRNGYLDGYIERYQISNVAKLIADWEHEVDRMFYTLDTLAEQLELRKFECSPVLAMMLIDESFDDFIKNNS